jgi:hypothetical protein
MALYKVWVHRRKIRLIIDIIELLVIKAPIIELLVISIGSNKLNKRTINNRANLLIIIIIELGNKGPNRIYSSYSLF